MKPSEVLDLAADYIEQFGWCQGEFASPNVKPNRFCALGAIGQAEFDDPWDGLGSNSKYFLGRVVDRTLVGSWNDEPNRTRPQVTRALWQAAELARREGQ